MTEFNNLIEQFNEALFKVANVWRTQNSTFNDKKIQEFGTLVLQPISNSGKQINDTARNLDYSLNMLMENGLIYDK